LFALHLQQREINLLIEKEKLELARRTHARLFGQLEQDQRSLAEVTEILGTDGEVELTDNEKEFKSGKAYRQFTHLQAELERDLRNTRAVMEELNSQPEDAKRMDEHRERSAKLEQLQQQIRDVVHPCEEEVMRLEAEVAERAAKVREAERVREDLSRRRLAAYTEQRQIQEAQIAHEEREAQREQLRRDIETLEREAEHKAHELSHLSEKLDLYDQKIRDKEALAAQHAEQLAEDEAKCVAVEGASRMEYERRHAAAAEFRRDFDIDFDAVEAKLAQEELASADGLQQLRAEREQRTARFDARQRSSEASRMRSPVSRRHSLESRTSKTSAASSPTSPPQTEPSRPESQRSRPSLSRSALA
jgi:hypothetical protein